MNAGMAQSDGYAVERQSFVLRVQAQCHGRASAEPRQQEVVWPGAAIEAADCDRLVSKKPVPAGSYLLLENNFSDVWQLQKCGRRFRCRRLHRSANGR